MSAMRELLREAGATPEQLEAAADVLRRADEATLPWYIRAATGLGAWLAACLVLGFLTLTGLFREQGVNFVVGFVMLAAAVALSRQSVAGEFVRQLALVLGLAGQGFVLASLDILGLHSTTSLMVCGGVLAAGMFVLHRDPVHRFFCAGGVLAAALGAASGEHASVGAEFALLLGLSGAVALGAVRGHALPPDVAAMVGPGRFGLLVTCLGVLAFSVSPGLRDEYMSPLTSVGVTALLGVQMYRDMAALRAAPARRLLLLPVLGVVGWASLSAPGVAVALLVLGLGLRERDGVLVLGGVVFLGLFLSAYYMEMTLPLWHKAGVLVASGLFAFACRAVLLRLLPADDAAGEGVQ